MKYIIVFPSPFRAPRLELLLSAVGEALLTLPPRELQSLAVDQSGAAVISFALRVLYSPGIVEVSSWLAYVV